ncbi:MarR family winged helix-turn-helix transcriptional regulator [Plantactinospora sp. BC1]|uniref:MarR family winged helix-turn-helix transcriptional regulator n=1 Tax=Plantactinospora sp. BC1 TaxID=2108470 RepID=UPI00131F2833|nr:MarR family winged helix-turn-helix transcriptional regulator [Plantactinospora sp. BC1]
MASGGRVLFSFVRYWSRRWTGVGLGVDAERGRDVMVVEAVAALTGRGVVASVNDVARELGVDQSGASRMVSRAERLGLLSRVRPSVVGGTTAISVTGEGRELLCAAYAWQDEVLRTLTADWSRAEVRTLVELMGRLVEAQHRIDSH